MAEKGKRIAVFFPGIGYHCDKPLLYYGRKLAAEAGCGELCSLSYTYQKGNLFGNEEKIREALGDLYRQAEASLSDLNWADYEEILFVSKSLGTAIAAAYAERHGLDCRQILYTPLAETFEAQLLDAVAFTGTADPWAETARLRALCAARGIPLAVVEGGNHSLETGDPLRDLDILRSVMAETRAWLGREH